MCVRHYLPKSLKPSNDIQLENLTSDAWFERKRDTVCLHIYTYCLTKEVEIYLFLVNVRWWMKNPYINITDLNDIYKSKQWIFQILS